MILELLIDNYVVSCTIRNLNIAYSTRLTSYIYIVQDSDWGERTIVVILGFAYIC